MKRNVIRYQSVANRLHMVVPMTHRNRQVIAMNVPRDQDKIAQRCYVADSLESVGRSLQWSMNRSDLDRQRSGGSNLQPSDACHLVRPLSFEVKRMTAATELSFQTLETQTKDRCSLSMIVHPSVMDHGFAWGAHVTRATKLLLTIF